MKKNILLILSVFLVYNCFAQESESIEISTYYLIRHAEKDRSDASNKNPSLTQQGHKRAAYWADVLKNVKFDAVYSTDYNRTQQTAMPVAKVNEVQITSYHPYKMDFKSFLKATKGKTVLIVGHSNTTPMFANRLLNSKKYKDIADDNNGNLYIITVTKDAKSSQLLTIN